MESNLFGQPWPAATVYHIPGAMKASWKALLLLALVASAAIIAPVR